MTVRFNQGAAGAAAVQFDSADFDIVGIGNAIVDVFSQADDQFLENNGIAKGATTLIDAARAEELYARMGPGVEVSGGSAANTLAGVANFGARGAYIGKVRDDQLGEVFRHDIRAAGVHYETAPATDGLPTARCLILVTPDAQRSMNTFLGASVDLGPEDVEEQLIARAAITYLEGYLWDRPRAKDAFRKAAAVARGAGRWVALTLSDRFCVDRHRAEFLELISGDIDLLFANESEITALFQTGQLAEAITAVRDHCRIAVVTRSEAGSVVITGHTEIEIGIDRVDGVVDTTGAGDLYAAGFLAGLTRGRPLADCGHLGALAAGEVISHYGARPETDLAALAAARGIDLAA